MSIHRTHNSQNPVRFPIQFENPNNRLPDEKRSKLLKKHSNLWDWCEMQRSALVNAYPDEVAPKRIDYHLELIGTNTTPTESLLVQRSQELEGKEVVATLNRLKNAIVVNGPHLDGYGQTHITVAYFPRGIPSGAI